MKSLKNKNVPNKPQNVTGRTQNGHRWLVEFNPTTSRFDLKDENRTLYSGPSNMSQRIGSTRYSVAWQLS